MIRRGKERFLSFFFLLSLSNFYSIRNSARKLSSLPRISSGFYWKKRDVDGTESKRSKPPRSRTRWRVSREKARGVARTTPSRRRCVVESGLAGRP